MGIRCCCPNGHKINVKAEQAGKIGICPVCKLRFQIPFGNAQAPVQENESHTSKRESESDPSLKSLGLEELGNSADSKKLSASFSEPEPDSGPDVWYFIGDDGQQYGPMSKSAVQDRIKDKRVSKTTRIWQEGGRVHEARDLFPELTEKKVNKSNDSSIGCGSWLCLIIFFIIDFTVALLYSDSDELGFLFIFFGIPVLIMFAAVAITGAFGAVSGGSGK